MQHRSEPAASQSGAPRLTFYSSLLIINGLLVDYNPRSPSSAPLEIYGERAPCRLERLEIYSSLPPPYHLVRFEVVRLSPSRIRFCSITGPARPLSLDQNKLLLDNSLDQARLRLAPASIRLTDRFPSLDFGPFEAAVALQVSAPYPAARTRTALVTGWDCSQSAPLSTGRKPSSMRTTLGSTGLSNSCTFGTVSKIVQATSCSGATR